MDGRALQLTQHILRITCVYAKEMFSNVLVILVRESNMRDYRIETIALESSNHIERSRSFRQIEVTVSQIIFTFTFFPT